MTDLCIRYIYLHEWWLFYGRLAGKHTIHLDLLKVMFLLCTMVNHHLDDYFWNFFQALNKQIQVPETNVSSENIPDPKRKFMFKPFIFRAFSNVMRLCFYL